MSCGNFFSFNLVTARGTELSSTSNDAFYPVENIQHDHTTKVYRSQIGVNTASVTFDFKTIEPVDSIVIAPSSVDGWGFSGAMTIEANGTANFSSPAFTTTLTPNYDFNLGIKELGSVQSYRFWRITASGVGDYVEFSKIFIGSKLTLANNNIDFGWSFQLRDNSAIVTNRYRQRFIDTINTEKVISASYKLLDISEVETLMGMFDDHGVHKPFFMVVDNSESIITNKERFAGYFYFDTSPTILNNSFALYDATIKLGEGL